MRKSEATAGSPVPTAEVGIGNRKALSRKARTSSGALVWLMPGGQPLWAGNFPFVHCTFLFCFAPRKRFALFCRAKKYQKTLEAPQAARLRLVLPGSEVLAPALDVRDCPFSGAVPVSGFKRNHGPSPGIPVAMVLPVVGSWQETAKARSLPSTAGNGPVVLVFCPTLSFRVCSNFNDEPKARKFCFRRGGFCSRMRAIRRKIQRSLKQNLPLGGH